MTSSQNLEVLIWQLIAGLLMGTDYFLNERKRSLIDAYLKKKLNTFQRITNSTMKGAIEDAKSLVQTWLLAIAPILLSMGLIFYVMPHLHLPEGILTAIVGLIALSFFLWGAILAYYGIFAHLFKLRWLLAIYLFPLWVVSMFLLKSPKGVLAAAGMLCLARAFWLRYAYIAI